MDPSDEFYRESMIKRLRLRAKTVAEKAERIVENYVNGPKFTDFENEANRIWLDGFTGGKGFDIACGDFLIGDVVQALGVDGAPKMLGTDYWSEGDEFPWQPDNTLDYVVSNYLDGMPAPLKALKEWRRVIKPGGKVALISRDADTYGSPSGALENGRRQSCYTLLTLKNYMNRAGFKNVLVERHSKTQSLRGSGTK